MSKPRAKREKKGKANPKSTKGVQQSNEALVKKSGDLEVEQSVSGEGKAGGGESSSMVPVPPLKNGKQKGMQRDQSGRFAIDEAKVAILKDRFLDALKRRLGPGAACDEIGIDRKTAYRWKDRDESFSEDWNEAIEHVADRIEDRLVALTENINQPHKVIASMFLLKKLRPEYRDRMEVTGPGGGPILMGIMHKIKSMDTDTLRQELSKLLGPAICIQPGEKSDTE